MHHMRTAIELLIMHHENMRCLYPDERLLVVCECEGAVYDMRSLALHVLRSFDRVHDTGFFRTLRIDQLPQPLPEIDELLYRLTIPIGISSGIAAWYSRHLWDLEGLRYAHRPLGNVMKIFRCLELQKHTHVGLCAERAGRSDEEFFSAVNALGQPARMTFERSRLYLDDATDGEHASERAIRACRHFQALGYRLIAVIDGRCAAGLLPLCSVDKDLEILLLQAKALREMLDTDIPLPAAGSADFRLWDLMRENPSAGTFGDGAWYCQDQYQHIAV
jgi:hypothetical protein